MKINKVVVEDLKNCEPTYDTKGKVLRDLVDGETVNDSNAKYLINIGIVNQIGNWKNDDRQEYVTVDDAKKIVNKLNNIINEIGDKQYKFKKPLIIK